MSETGIQQRNLVICSDGTGNSAGKGRGTNVWQLYEALDRKHASVTQLAVHDDGVGTSSNTILSALGGAFGFGLARNVRELYAWLCTQYDPRTDRIYLFGFSRGAFTVRCLAGMIARFGIIQGKHKSRVDLQREVQRVWFAYKQAQSRPGANVDVQKSRPWIAKLLDRLKGRGQSEFFPDVQIEFVGVWDTVDAYGLPIDELKEAFAWAGTKFFRFWPLNYLAMTRFSDRKLSPKVLHAYHAVATDDERHTFTPVLWDEGSRPESQTLEQVWFSGMHSDVGGGYVRRSLSLVPLDWMMQRAENHGLKFDAHRKDRLRSEANSLGPMHDSRSGLSSFYRYRPRDVHRLCKEHNIAKPLVHASVLERVDGLHAEDAPGVFPADFDVQVDGANDSSAHLVRPYGDCLVRLRALYKKRLAVYFGFVAWAIALGAVLIVFGDQATRAPAPEWGSLGLGYLVSLVEKYTPEMIGGVVRTLRGVPFYTLLLVLALVALRMVRTHLIGRVRELRRAAWDEEFRGELYDLRGWPMGAPSALPTPAAATGATEKKYEKTLMARLIVLIVAIAFVVWVVRWARTGTLFPPNATVETVGIDDERMPEKYEFDFDTRDPGYRVAPVLEKGARYRISVEVKEPWWDSGLEAGPDGLKVEPTPVMQALSLTRRNWTEEWFALLGSLGGENGKRILIGSGKEIEVSEDTRLYLFVNDATCYLCPKGPWAFYENNKGTARVTIHRLPGK